MAQWRYILMATRFLSSMLRRDGYTSPELAKFFAQNAANAHPTIRHYAQKSVDRRSGHYRALTLGHAGA
jgi:hypothetical protein